jgi:hypothetical protein
MAKKPSKKPSSKPGKPAARKKKAPKKTPKQPSIPPAPPVTESVSTGIAPAMASAAADSGPPPATFRGIVRNGVVVFDASAPPDGTRVEVNTLQAAPGDRKAVGFTLTLTREFDMPGGHVVQEFDLIVKDEKEQPELQTQNIARDIVLIKSLLRRIADKDADVGWDFQAINGRITG